MTVVGARPQFIKASPVSRALQIASVTEILVHTGQHYDPDMSDVFFRELELKHPDINLEVGSGSHGRQTAEMLVGLEAVFQSEQPDCVLIYGDTNSTLAGALAASKLGLPIAHVESGLRSFNRAMPEEINRVVADCVSDLLFTPTLAATENLKNEGVDSSRIKQVGDVMFDAALMHAQRAARDCRVLDSLGLRDCEFILVTIHRAENTNSADKLRTIVAALRTLNEEYPVVFPAHPRTRKALASLGLLGDLSECRLISPVGFLDMVMLESAASLIVTDSGGVQKEAFFHKRPCLTLRDETEWVELVELGWNRLCRVEDSSMIVQCARDAIGSRGQPAQPYGDGSAAVRIAEIVSTLLTDTV